MKRLREQEQVPSIRRLREILHALPSESRTDNEWKLLENSLFARLDEESRETRAAHHRRAPWPSFSPAWLPAAAAALVVVVSLVAIGPRRFLSPAPLADSRIMSSKGTLRIGTGDDRTVVEPGTLPSIQVRAGQLIDIEQHGLAAVRLETNTGIVLADGARLVVEQADHRLLRLRLERGSLVAQVSKRAPRQRFEIVTPNAQCRVIGTVFRVETEPSRTELSVFKGSVEMSAADGSGSATVVAAGQSATLRDTRIEETSDLDRPRPPVREISILKLALEDPDRGEAARRGIVEVVSTPPGAKVIIGTEVVGKTPMVVVRPAGATEIELIHPDCHPVQGAVEIKPNEIHTFARTLESSEPPSRGRERRAARRTVRTRPRRRDEVGSIVENPDYVEALIQMTIGEYRKALTLLDSLAERPEASSRDRSIIAAKMRECYQGLGNFERALAVHEQRYRTARDSRTRAAALWQTATIRATCLGDYEGAERDLVNYIVAFPKGAWIEQAYLRLAEVQTLAGNHQAAAQTYRRHLERFPKGANRPKAIHARARLLGGQLRKYREAVELYDLILNEYASGKYAESALFHRARCLSRLRRPQRAAADYRAYLARYPEGHWREACARGLRGALASTGR